MASVGHGCRSGGISEEGQRSAREVEPPIPDELAQRGKIPSFQLRCLAAGPPLGDGNEAILAIADDLEAEIDVQRTRARRGVARRGVARIETHRLTPL